MTTDYLGNEIKEGMEVCSITVVTGGYFRNIQWWIPMQKGVHSVVDIPNEPEVHCWEINWCNKVESINGMLCLYSESKEIAGYTPLNWVNIGKKEILAIKGMSDNEDMYRYSLNKQP